MPPSETPPTATSKKRKDAPAARDASVPKRSKPQPWSPPTSLIGPHEALLSQLRPKHNVLALSVISSTKIRKRVVQSTSHLGGSSDLPAVVLLYARTAEVCKMITIVEQCRRLLGSEGKSWFQYNQLFDLPAAERDVVEETAVLAREQGESSDDGFEVMASRFERAIAPVRQERAVRSLRVLLSVEAIGDLRGKDGFTMQSREDGA